MRTLDECHGYAKDNSLSWCATELTLPWSIPGKDASILLLKVSVREAGGGGDLKNIEDL